MKNESTCSYSGNRDEAIVDYLYGEIDSATHAVFEAHLAQCAACRLEIRALGGVRRVLTEWAPPEPIRALDHSIGTGPRAVAPARHVRFGDMPLWARAAAAVLCLGVGLGAANLRISYGPQGLSVRTGWMGNELAASGATAAATSEAAPWRAELSAMRDELRNELRRTPTATPASDGRAATDSPADADRDALVRQVRALLAQSEQRQQRELALRIGDLSNDVQAQRRADLARIDRSIGLVQNSTGMEVLRQREMLNSLAVRVSQRP